MDETKKAPAVEQPRPRQQRVNEVKPQPRQRRGMRRWVCDGHDGRASLLASRGFVELPGSAGAWPCPAGRVLIEMRGGRFLILAYVIVAVQLGLSGYANWAACAESGAAGGGLRGDERQAGGGAAGGLLLGLMQDLFTQSPLGLYAFAYALAGLFVVGTSAGAKRDHPVTHLGLTLGAGAGGQWGGVV